MYFYRDTLFALRKLTTRQGYHVLRACPCPNYGLLKAGTGLPTSCASDRGSLVT